MAYFRNLPKIGYDFNRDGIIQNVVDIFRQVRPLQNFVDDVSAYKFYEVPNGQRPDICSRKLYGTSDYHWTFFILNEFLHDGIGVWPMSQENLFDYIKTEYNGVAIETRPDIQRNTDGGITDFRDSLAGRFNVGEIAVGGLSGAKGTVTKKDLQNNQLIIQNITNGTAGVDPISGGSNSSIEGGAFRGDGVGNVREAIIGQTSTDSITSWKVYDYAEAPHHWFVEGDVNQTEVANANFFSTTDNAETNLIIQYGSTAAPTFIINRNYLFNLNEQRSKIKIIDPAYIARFVDDYENLING